MKASEKDYAVQSQLDMEFHRTIIEWSNIDVFLRIWGMLTNHIQRYITMLNPTVWILPEEVHQYHEALVKTLEEKEVEKAKVVFKEHIMKMVEK
ncbi:FCD domain-containing protein [Rossellomorea vietnamensis]|nr:FCD domain-containing protein [Rossellomorea vietnamensis]